jgi:hypothetical protein
MTNFHGVLSKSDRPARQLAERSFALGQSEGKVMNYTLLIFESAEDFAARDDPAREETYWRRIPPYLKALRDAGVFAGGAGLEQPNVATTMRLHGGQRLVQDGPYADAKEQLAGFFVIDVPDLDRALEWAARYPLTAGGLIEIRPNLPPFE